jgi:hypothetical protein
MRRRRTNDWKGQIMHSFRYGLCWMMIGCLVMSLSAVAQESSPLPTATISGAEDGWVILGKDDFAPVNGDDDTWTWKDGLLACSGLPIGVMRSQKTYTNFELMVEWRHLKSAGNSGVFVWVPMKALDGLAPGKLPGFGIEVQMLDHGYKELHKSRTGKDGDWFSTNGDIFAVGGSKLNPFPPLSPSGARSFPSKDLSKGFGEWNHYYVRCINGEVRLWVNGEEVSGGNNADPKTGYFCLESEGSPIEFKNIKIRELP